MHLFTLPNNQEIAHYHDLQTSLLYKEIFIEETYLKHGLHLENAKVVFDVGANIGLFSLFANKKAPGASIYSFEPIPQTAEILLWNMAKHKVPGQVIQEGLGSAQGKFLFKYYPRAATFSGRFSDEQEDSDQVKAIIQSMGGSQDAFSEENLEAAIRDYFRSENISCKVNTVSNCIERLGVQQIDFLKIDTEKSEIDILKGISKQDWKKIKQVALEVHSEYLLKQVEEILKENQFKYYTEERNNTGKTEVQAYMLYAHN